MADIRIAFWNLENLFDTTLSELAADFEFTPEHGWDEAALEAKLASLARVVRAMHDGQGPDLLGICEVENAGLARRLATATGRADYRVAHVESPDIRGIDVSLIYSLEVFAEPEIIREHVVHFRYPTRDIFEVHLRVPAHEAELAVLVNHWPSRKQGQYESEPMRIAVAEHCGRVVDGVLKASRAELLALPASAAGLAELNRRWNRNVLVMGDLNDEPYDRSVLHYLRGAKDLDHVEEVIKPAPGKPLPEPRTYLGARTYLFNCMWPLLGTPDRGTLHFGEATNSMNLLDQFLVSRGLFYGASGLRIDPASVSIFTPAEMTTPKGRPRPFDRATHKGGSDHFPITAVVRTV